MRTAVKALLVLVLSLGLIELVSAFEWLPRLDIIATAEADLDRRHNHLTIGGWRTALRDVTIAGVTEETVGINPIV